MDIYLILKHLSKDTRRVLISRDGIGWKVKLTIRLNDHVIWVEPNKVNRNEMDYGGWNEWDRLWTDGNEMKHKQWSANWRKWHGTWTMKCELKEMRWNINNEVWTEENEMKHKQWSLDWRKWDGTWTMKLIM